MPITVECGFSGYPDNLQKLGPTIGVRIGFDSQFSPGQVPDIPSTIFPALIDTGAGESCIDKTLAETLRLPEVDKQLMGGVHGKERVTIHMAQLYYPNLARYQYGRFAALDLKGGGFAHQALIGRTFLSGVVMRYDGLTGSVTLERA